MAKKQPSTYQISLDFHLTVDPSAVPPTDQPDALQTSPSVCDRSLSLDLHPTALPSLTSEQSRLSTRDQTPRSKQLELYESPTTGDASEPSSTLTVVADDGPPSKQYLWPSGTIFSSPGSHFTYRVIGPCCRLFDREELPWPCCRIQWRSKEPSWRRIGKRFVPDQATKRSPSYVVEILDQDYSREPFVITLYWIQFPPAVQNWWHRRYVPNQAE